MGTKISNLFVATSIAVLSVTSWADESTQGQLALKADDYLKVMRAVIMTEKRENRKQFISMGTGPKYATDLEAPAGPLRAQEANNECGNAMELNAYNLQLQGVPRSHLFFYQMHGPNGFLGPAYPHGVLVYETVDRGNRPIFLFFDVTYPQFLSGVEALRRTATGKEVLTGIREEGFWIATDQKLAAYADAFPHISQGPYRAHTTADLAQHYWNVSEDGTIDQKWIWSINWGRTIVNEDGTASDGTDDMRMRELLSIGSADIAARIRAGQSSSN